ncbi:hypothetical protein BST97_14135 [Nonlabens spongiae]|uniref:Secretion system C-terminal sorting domain-containing protein n=1 Tax=Nonlabens spongiae TaxID=331648 RepID=A0A1W6MNE0_9FLAO|nr:T9SS type A sorting domain-containing protein [Nonlabens spongiae]ARN79036.1 hypothetical protein BST97_14135 [Nonlabens spongiae]
MRILKFTSCLLAFAGLMHAQQISVSSARFTSNQEMNTPPSPNNVQPITSTLSTPIWGTGAAIGSSEGQFANAFINAGSYSPGDNVSSWTALSIYDNGGANIPGAAYWTRSTLGYSQGAYWNGTIPVASPTAANGVAIFDSDYMDNNGTQLAFGTGTSPSSHKGELISPRIDLTGHADEAMKIEFFSFYRNFQISELSVSISTDDGSTWTTADYRSLTADQTEEMVSVIFSNATAGVTNLSQCRIKFTFDGDYYFAIVDDVSIEPATSADLTIDILNSGNSVGFEYGDQVHITGNRFFPISQIIQDARYISFGANVKNIGAITADLSDAPALNLLVERGDDINGWVAVHTQNLSATQSIDPNDGVTLTGILDDTSWMTLGSYRVTYTATFNGTDADNSNNTAIHFFDITANNYISKVGVDTNGDPLYTRRIFPGGGPFQEWELGSVFNLENASGSGIEISAINYVYYIATNYNGAANHTLYAHIYSINDANNDGVINDRTELTQVGLAESNLTGLGTTVINGSYGTASFNNFTDPMGSNTLGTLPSGKYYISIVTNPSLSGGLSTFNTGDVPWLGVSEEKNYNMNVGFIPNPPSDFIINPSPLSMTDSSGAESFNWLGFGADIIPSMSIEINTTRNTSIADGSYGSNSTWSNGVVPTDNETVYIDNDISIDSDVTITGDVTINNSKSLSIKPGKVLTLDGNLDNSAGGNIVFESDATGNGQLLVNTGGSLSGPAIVERFIPALNNSRRAFRFITPAVTSTGSIYENWQENGNTPAGFGTHITGSTTGANGFDQTISGNPSMFTYEHLNNSWEAISNTDTNTLQAGKAYRILVRGDRNFDLNNGTVPPVNSNVILRTKGSLELADVEFKGEVVNGNDSGALSRQAGEFSFIGNPYQAIVDFENLAKININPNFVYIWNPNLGTSGAYETVDVSGAIDSRQFIQPGQAFFVLTVANGDTSLTFNEAAKSVNNFSNSPFSIPSISNYVDITLTDANELVLDKLKINFDGENEVNNMDAPKLFNQYENIYIESQGRNLSIEHRALPSQSETVPLFLSGHDRSDFKLTLDINIPMNLTAMLMDNLDRTSTVLSQGENIIEFQADPSISGSMDLNRFELRFNLQTLSIADVNSNVDLYPNPSSNGQISISSQLFSEGDVTLSLHNIMGQEILRKEVIDSTSDTLKLNTQGIAAGTYILQINSAKVMVSKKIILR